MANKAKIKYFILLIIERNGNLKIIEMIRNKQKIDELTIKSTLDNITNRSIPKKNINE
jgi:hypothetical protein|tara:strand:- start:226 stop:399 length:174 start_codon:yes stop_codon:yes gene_type:complete